ncbi:MAG TPA: MFS transporter [Stellaceae bacterium]|jgi:AAHS family 4-hydroxybenzoate transporter-like MFS transporter|nr:MFS transporter [Stellaceae bacterium]
MPGRSINVTELIDGRGFGRFQFLVALWCGFLVIIDGFDIGTTAYVVPVMAPLWNVSPAGFAPVFLSTLIGVLFGTLAAGPLADRFGRKRVALGAVATFGVFELATLLVGAITPFIVVRFLTGLGIGALMPISIALTAEYAPQRIRTTMTAIMYLGFPIGVGTGGFIAAEIIHRFGWQSMFVIGGAIPLLLLPFAAMALPESIRFLVVRGDRPGEVARLLNKLTGRGDYAASDSYTIAEERTRGFSVKQLFAEGRGVDTTLLWVAFFCNLLIIYSINAWLPTVLKETGVELGTTFRLTGAFSAGGVIAILLLGPIVDRLGATTVVTCLFLIAAIAVIGIGWSGGSVPLLAATIIVAGGCVTAGQSFCNILAAALYPTTMRSTGIAWALGIGRAGTMLGPIVGSLMLAAKVAPAAILYSTAVPAAIAAVAILLLGRRMHRRPTESSTPAAVQN